MCKSKNSIFQLFILLIIGTVSGVFLSEALLRISIGVGLLHADNAFVMFLKQQESTAVSGSIYRTSEDPVLGIELIPGSSSGDIRVNSFGFRGKEYAKTPPEGVERIAFLGDSETFGAFQKENENITGQLEIELNKLGGGDRKFEVLNFGFPGYNTVQEHRVLLNKAIQFNPSVVVLYYVFNDPVLDVTTTLEKRSLLHNSNFYNLLMFFKKMQEPSFYKYQHESGNVVDFYKKIHNSKQFEFITGHIRTMTEYLADRNIPLYMLIAPEVIGFKNFTVYPYQEIHKKLAALGIPKLKVVDPLPAFVAENIDPREYWVIPSDCHKNTRANGLMAGMLAKRIFNN